MTIKPVSDHVLIKPVEAEETTQGGFLLAQNAQEKPQISEVIAVGPGGVVDGVEVEMYLKPGDKVVAAKFAGTQIKVDNEECTIIRLSDVLAIVE